MIKERRYFLKRTIIFNFFMIVLALIFLYIPLLLTSSNYFSGVLIIAVSLLYLFSQLIGFWRLSFAYFGLSIFFLTISLSCIAYFVRGVMLKPTAPDDIAIHVGIPAPFNYVILFLYFSTLAFILLKAIKYAKTNDQFASFIFYNKDVDLEKKLIFLDYLPAKNKAPRLEPRKQKLSIWLTVITQIALVKMSWNSTVGGTLSLVSFSLIGMLALIISVGCMQTVGYQIKYARQLGLYLRPALRKPFSLKQWIIDGQKNSY